MNTLKRYQLWIALAVLVLPIVGRGLWFYQGLPKQPQIQTPDYAGYSIPRPPVSTPAAEDLSVTTGKIIVLDRIHGNQYDPSEIKAFLAALTARGARVEIDDGSLALATRLKYANAYVVFSPTYPYSAEETVLVQRFIQHGGRLIVFTDPTRGMTEYDWFSGMVMVEPDVNAANVLLAPYDITFTNDYLYNLVKNEGNFRNVLFGQFGKNGLTDGLEQVAFYGAHSVETESGTALILGDENTLSSQTDSGGPSPDTGLAAAALSKDGNVLAIGDFSFLIPPYNQIADNHLLIGAIADFAVGGTRTHDLADFPFVFDRSVHLFATGEAQLSADLLAPIGRLQSTLQTTNTVLVVSEEPPTKGDRLILGLLTPSESLDAFIEPFKLGLDDFDSVTIPGIGKVSRSGIGLMLYRPGTTGNTLILLTDSISDLPTLIDLLASGDLSSCVIQDNIGVCSVGSGWSTDNYNDLYTPSEESVPIGTLTPVKIP